MPGASDGRPHVHDDLGEAYERGRPGWPRGVIARLVQKLQLSIGDRVADIGAGTGMLARALVDTGLDTTMVEPRAEMRATAAGSVPRARLVAGRAEAIPLDEGSVDAIFVGDSFHWFAVDAVVPEFVRVLKPGAGLAVLWHTGAWSEETHDWLPGLRDALGSHGAICADSRSQSDRGQWAEKLISSGHFEPLGHLEAEQEHVVGAEDFVALVRSWGSVSALGDGERASLLAAVRALVEAELDRTAVEVIRLPYRVDAYWTRAAERNDA
jgi:SAM-dependent methyltransferase